MTENKKVPYADVQNLLAKLSFEFLRTGQAGTICTAYLGTFRIAQGYSACVVPEEYSQELGEKYAKQRCLQEAENKIWELLGFSLFKELNPQLFS